MANVLRARVGLAALWVLLPSAVGAQEVCSIANLAGCGEVVPGGGLEAVLPALEEALDHTVAVPTVLSLLLGDVNTPVRIGDLSLRFKTFEAQSADEAAMGFSYDYQKSLARSSFPTNSADLSRFDLSVLATGNVAFHVDANPHDFLETKVNFGWLKSKGGVAQTELTEEELDARGESIALIVDEIAKLPTLATVRASPGHRRILNMVHGLLSTQTVFSVNANASLESDQRFDTRNRVYGGTLGLEVHAWNPNSPLAKLNFFDWPFALLRYLTGADDNIRPRGSALPSLRASLHQVDPEGDSIRAALGEMDTFTRASFEAGYRTAAGTVGDRSLYFEANARYYKQLSPSDVITAAGLDDFLFFVMALTTDDGLYVSYSTGELPFDRSSDQVYEVGFRYKF